MRETFEANKSENLHGVIVWIPMLAEDTIQAATDRERLFSDRRVHHFWDQDRNFGRSLAQTLSLKEPIAWDVYLVYPPDHSWDTDLPPVPTFWMHQLNEEPALLLDPARLKDYVQTTLDRIAFP